MRTSKWAGQYCVNDPVRSPAEDRGQHYTLEDIAERAARGEAPGSSPGRLVLRPGVWKPQGRPDMPPAAAYKDNQTGQFGLALRE
eukprot:15454793-Alexandrium_andersonii.AAC.1